MYWRLSCAIFLVLGTYAVSAVVVDAASLYVDPNTSNVLKGDTVTVAVRIDTDEGECINAVDVTLAYTDGIQAVDVSTGRSILTLWLERPVINRDARTITFAAGIPNGYCGRIPGDPSLTNVLAEIVFRAPGFSVGKKEDASTLLTFEPGTRVLLNDGSGSDAPLRTLSGTINLIQETGTTTKDAWGGVVAADDVPPTPFSIELVRNPQIFNNKYYIVWNTTDKQSGIDHYEVLEESPEDFYAFRWGAANNPWITVESPYVLKDQTLRSVIRVRALDKAGNEQISVLVPDKALQSIHPIILLIGGILIALFVGGILLAIWMLLRRRKKVVSDDISHEHTT